MSKAAVFHHIGESGDYTNTIEQILAYDGLVTFDGAYKSVWENAYLMRGKLKHMPIIFVQGDTVGTEGVCNRAEILTLSQTGFLLGWHGWSHRRLPELSDDEVRKELSPPDWLMANALYAYPHGDFDERTKQLVREAGFWEGYSTTQGNDDRYSLHREYI